MPSLDWTVLARFIDTPSVSELPYDRKTNVWFLKSINSIYSIKFDASLKSKVVFQIDFLAVISQEDVAYHRHLSGRLRELHLHRLIHKRFMKFGSVKQLIKGHSIQNNSGDQRWNFEADQILSQLTLITYRFVSIIHKFHRI